jgi:hypothetical protein
MIDRRDLKGRGGLFLKIRRQGTGHQALGTGDKASGIGHKAPGKEH